MKRILILFLLLLGLSNFVLPIKISANVSGSEVGNLKFVKIGFLFGKVSIGPVCPIEPCQIPKDFYSNYKVVVSNGAFIRKIKIAKSGFYFAKLKPGVYKINIDPNYWEKKCDPSGICAPNIGSSNVPAEIEIKSGLTTRFDIIVDTGIR